MAQKQNPGPSASLGMTIRNGEHASQLGTHHSVLGTHHSALGTYCGLTFTREPSGSFCPPIRMITPLLTMPSYSGPPLLPPLVRLLPADPPPAEATVAEGPAAKALALTC